MEERKLKLVADNSSFFSSAFTDISVFLVGLVTGFLIFSLLTGVFSGNNASKPLPSPFFLPAINRPPC